MLTTTEAAEIMGTSPEYVRVAISRGRLKARKFGTAWMVSRAELTRYAAENAGKRGRPRKDPSP